MRQVLPSCLVGTVTQLLSSQVSLTDDYKGLGFRVFPETLTDDYKRGDACCALICEMMNMLQVTFCPANTCSIAVALEGAPLARDR